jgi:hypothetical protein
VTPDWQELNPEDFMLSSFNLQKGIAYYGSNERLRVKLDALKRGSNLTIAAIGGSITAGQNVLDGFFVSGDMTDC